MNLPAHIPQTILETPRLLLKEVNPEIYAWIFSNSSDEELMQNLGMNSQQLELEKFKVKNGMTTYRMTFKMFILVEKASGTTIGRCALHNWFAEHGRAELGYNMSNEEWKGKGFMKEAIRPIVKFGFEKLQLNRIEALISPTNMPSLRLVHGMGFTLEGTLRQHYNSNGIVDDSAVYGLLRSEWEAGGAYLS
jgi:ribosomal-protein-alanine N-acetyltransferase